MLRSAFKPILITLALVIFMVSFTGCASGDASSSSSAVLPSKIDPS